MTTFLSSELLTTSMIQLAMSATTTEEPYIVLPGPEDVSTINKTNGLYQQSVTLTARMFPPIEAGPPNTFWGLPVIIWGILTGCIILLLLLLTTLFLCCYLLPRRRKLQSPSRYNSSNAGSRGIIMAHHSSVVAKPWSAETNHLVMPMSVGIVPPQYSAPPSFAHQHNHLKHQSQNRHYSQSSYYPTSPICGIRNVDGNNGSSINIPETHKSMWAVNPLYASNTVLNDTDSTYRTRSLPVWGKSKQRPVSTTDDLEELYAKVNFSKKRRNRMRNDEAAIIALCRSRSQNLAGLPLEREGVVVYDERTAL